MPYTKPRPDRKALPFIAAAHSAEDAAVVAASLRMSAERRELTRAERDRLIALATEYEWANQDRHLFLREASANPAHAVKP